MAKIIIRKIKIEDFNKIYPLFKQLWPDKNLNKDKLKEVTQRGIKSKNDELFCAELNNEVIGFCAYTIMNSFFRRAIYHMHMRWLLMKNTEVRAWEQN